MERWKMIHKIKALYDDGNGCSKREIAKKVGISRNTVRKYLEMNEEEIYQKLNNLSRDKTLDPYRNYIVKQLQKYPKLSAVKLKRKMIAKGIVQFVSDRSFRRYINELKQTIPIKHERYYEPVIDMVPGVQCQIDLGEIRQVQIEGIPTTIYFVVFVLSYSRMMYFTLSNKPVSTKDFIKMHHEAFTFFGGTVEECVYDQTKLVSIKEEFREVWFNEEFYRYATFAHFDIRVCEGYDPESKGKVEAGVKYVKNSFFYGEEFESLSDLQHKRLLWLESVANVRIHGTTLKKPKEVFDAHEAMKLKGYGIPDYILQNNPIERKVDKTSLISYKSNKYSVPIKYKSSIVLLKEAGGNLVILDFDSKDVIAMHSVSEDKGITVKNRNHYRDHDKLIEDREREVVELIGNAYISKNLCRIIKTTCPKVYKDQLVGLAEILKIYISKDNIHNILIDLSKRPSLSVTFIREYLSSIYSDRQSQMQESSEPNGALSAYKSLSIKEALEDV